MQATLYEALAASAEAAGLEFDPVGVRRSVGRAERDQVGVEDDVWYSRLLQAGEDLGFRVVAARGDLAKLKATVSQGHPLVLVARPLDGAPAYLALTGASWRKWKVSGPESRWLTTRQLIERLGLPNADATIEWAILEPAAPCEALRDAEGGHHAHGLGHEPHHVGPTRRLMGLVSLESRDVTAVIFYAMGVGVLTLASPLAVEALVSTVAMSLMVQQLVVLSLILLGCLGLAAAFRALQTYVVEIIQRRIFVRVAADLAYRLPRVRVDAYDVEHGPELVNRFFDVLTVQKVASLLLLDGVALVLSSVIGLVVLAFYHPYLLGFDLVMVGAMLVLLFLLGRGGVRTSIQESRAKYALAGQIEELARVPVAYKGDGGPSTALDRVDALTRRYLAARRTHFRVVMRQVIFALSFQALSSAALLGLGGWLVIEGQLTLGQLVAAELIVATVGASFAKMGKHLEGWYDLMAAVEKLGHLVDLPLERTDGEVLVDRNREVGAAIQAEGVGFGYQHDREVLHGLNLVVAAGERVAVMGRSGSGKSTLGELLYGLRMPLHGHIAIDGVNLRDLTLGSLRRQVALVQGVEVIDGTVIDNVRMGRVEISALDVREALDAVGLSEEVASLPDGLHTRLSPDGSPLSLGQARRLMLARAMAGRPRVLVLDETLDGLDIDARDRVQATLFQRSNPWTLLVVTHDEETARLCDQVLVLANGHVDRAVGRSRMPELGDYLKEVRACRSA